MCEKSFGKPAESFDFQEIKPTTNETGGITVNSLMPLKEAVNEVERQLINIALERYGSTYKAAAALGVNQSTIVRKMARFRQTDLKLSDKSRYKKTES
jgi:transcriptional regulator with PAS, ATPase and Fis domain